MLKKTLGKTGLEISTIGFGGFHLVETPLKETKILLNKYLDVGGNYIETAPSYGNGISEKKIGLAISNRRNEYILTTKCHSRDGSEAEKILLNSFTNLKTDYIDIVLVHALQDEKDLETILSKNGSLDVLKKFKKQGKIGHIGVSSHGHPAALIKAIEECDFELFMTGINYFDNFNYLDVQNILLPLARKKNIGILGMKSLADGYLYKNPETAIKYALSCDIDCLVIGMNTTEQLDLDISLLEGFQKYSEIEKENIYTNAMELGNYVCRQCDKCDNNNFKPSEIFKLEGIYDRQMDDMTIPDSATFALRERLKHWFGQHEMAIQMYKNYKNKVDIHKDYSIYNSLCKYNINIDKKLKIAHSKLSEDGYIF